MPTRGLVRCAVALLTLTLLAGDMHAQSSAVDSVRALLGAGRDQEALSFAKAAVEARPGEAGTHCALAVVYDVADDQESAVKAAERCAELEPNVSDYQYILADALMELAGQKGGLGALGPAKRGKAAAEKSIALDSDNHAARMLLFFFHMDAPGIAGGSKKEAERQAAEIAKRDRRMGVYTRYRFRLEKAKDNELALLFNEALALSGAPGDSLGHAMATATGTAASVKSDALAEELVAKLFAAHPDDPRAQYYRARLWVLQGRNLGQAEKLFASYVELPDRPPFSPSIAGARWRLGMVYEKQGRKAEALQQYQMATELLPNWEQPREDLERFRKELGGG